VGKSSAVVYWRRRLVLTGLLAVVLSLLCVVVWVNNDNRTTTMSVPDATGEAVSVPRQAVPSCPDDALSLAVSGSKTVPRGEAQPLQIVVANSGTESCEVSLSSRALHVAVTSGSDKIWQTADCPSWAPTGSATIEAGGTHQWAVTWPGKRSAEDVCELSSGAVRSGTYVATATLTDVGSLRFVFSVR
jgi:hypothetical protein